MTKILFSLMVLMSLSACGKSPQESFMSHLNGISSDKAQFFSGDYQSDCTAIDFGGSAVYTREKLTFMAFDIGSQSTGDGQTYPTATANAFVDDSTLYSDAGCGHVLATNISKGKYTFANENKEVTFESSSSTLVSKDDTMTSALNSQSFCGYTSWTTNNSKDLLTGTCASEVKSTHLYVNALDSDVNGLELIQCSNAEMTDCEKMSFKKVN